MSPNTTKTNIKREGRQYEVDAETVRAGSVVDSDDSSAWETLREIGYEKGDVLPLASLGPGNNQSTTVSNSSFIILNNHLEIQTPLGDFTPDGTVQVRLMLRDANAGTDETLTVKISNSTDGEDVASVSTTSTTTTDLDSGWASYTPTTSGVITLRAQAKTDPGNNSSAVRELSFHVGVKI